MGKLTRNLIINTVINSIKDLDYVNAAWEVGAVAFKRVDQYSDVDIVVDCNDDSVEAVYKSFELAINKIAKIEKVYRVPYNEKFKMTQAFYRFSGESKYLMLDIGVIKTSSTMKFLEKEIHNNVHVFLIRIILPL